MPRRGHMIEIPATSFVVLGRATRPPKPSRSSTLKLQKVSTDIIFRAKTSRKPRRLARPSARVSVAQLAAATRLARQLRARSRGRRTTPTRGARRSRKRPLVSRSTQPSPRLGDGAAIECGGSNFRLRKYERQLAGHHTKASITSRRFHWSLWPAPGLASVRPRVSRTSTASS